MRHHNRARLIDVFEKGLEEPVSNPVHPKDEIDHQKDEKKNAEAEKPNDLDKKDEKASVEAPQNEVLEKKTKTKKTAKV